MSTVSPDFRHLPPTSDLHCLSVAHESPIGTLTSEPEELDEEELEEEEDDDDDDDEVVSPPLVVERVVSSPQPPMTLAAPETVANKNKTTFPALIENLRDCAKESIAPWNGSSAYLQAGLRLLEDALGPPLIAAP